MKMMKVFMTGGFPKDLWAGIARFCLYESDGFYAYKVGDFVAEAAENPSDFSLDAVEVHKQLDSWFFSNNTFVGEVVLIEHGSEDRSETIPGGYLPREG